tara:strand:- start:110 stop:703 length:594 start_codon:yes stop_codon:yes gene_type:complete
MATSVVQIVNNALIKIGASAITALTEDSEAARAANVIFEQVRDATIRDHVWNFATKRVQLAQETDAPAFEYSYQYALPSDCLRILQMEEKTMTYVIEGRKLLTDEGTAKVIYLAAISDPNEFDAMFVEAFSARLAAELAITLAESNTLYQNMMEVYRLKITDARSIDGQESGEPEIVADTWLDSRINYGGSLTVDVN